MGSTSRRLALTIALGLAVAGSAPAAAATRREGFNPCFFVPSSQCSRVRFTWMQGFNDPGTPNNLDRVGGL